MFVPWFRYTLICRPFITILSVNWSIPADNEYWRWHFHWYAAFFSRIYTSFNHLCSAGEYFFGPLKGYKIPLKTPQKPSEFDTNNPPPPGTEDELQVKREHVSPLEAVNGPDPSKMASMPAENTVKPSPDASTKKRSSLFSKSIIPRIKWASHLFNRLNYSDAIRRRPAGWINQIIQAAVLRFVHGQTKFTIDGAVALWVEESREEN